MTSSHARSPVARGSSSTKNGTNSIRSRNEQNHDTITPAAAAASSPSSPSSSPSSSLIWPSWVLCLLSFDRRCSSFLHTRSFFPYDLLLVPFALLCGIYSMPILIPLIGWWESERLAAVLLLSVLLTAGLTTAGKRLVRRVRPCPTTLGRKFFNIRALESNFSFPSGDSAQASVLAWNLFYYATGHIDKHGEPALAAGMFLFLIPTIMTARVYFGAHWWSDTIMGVWIRWFATIVAWNLVEQVFGWRIGQDEHRTFRVLTHMGFLHP